MARIRICNPSAQYNDKFECVSKLNEYLGPNWSILLAKFLFSDVEKL